MDRRVWRRCLEGVGIEVAEVYVESFRWEKM